MSDIHIRRSWLRFATGLLALAIIRRSGSIGVG